MRGVLKIIGGCYTRITADGILIRTDRTPAHMVRVLASERDPFPTMRYEAHLPEGRTEIMITRIESGHPADKLARWACRLAVELGGSVEMTVRAV